VSGRGGGSSGSGSGSKICGGGYECSSSGGRKNIAGENLS